MTGLIEQEQIHNPVKIAITSFMAYIMTLDFEMLFIWCLLVICDMLVAIMMSMKHGEFKTEILKGGLYQKSAEAVLLVALALIQRVAIIVGINVPVGSVLIGAFCFKEFASVLETFAKYGSTLPPVVSKWFKNANDQINVYNEGSGHDEY